MERSAWTVDCASCKGLCCTELYFSKCDGFPLDKPVGVPCPHLMDDYRCELHAELNARGLKGCTAYDCFGAGQRATATGADFQRLYRLHQIYWYLCCAADAAEDLRPRIDALLKEGETADNLDSYQDRANALLREVIGRTCTKGRPKRGDLVGKDFRRADLSGMDFSFTLLIASNFSGCRLRHVSLLGADLRDVDIRGADLSASLFLTQGQINGARGDGATILPETLHRPEHWG